MIKRFIIALILLGLLCGGLVGFNIFRQQMIADFFANMPRPSVTVSTTTVEPTTWTPGVDAVGTVVARQGVDVASQASGVVTQILFEANRKVEAGQPLVRLDTAVEQAELIAARAAVVRDQQALQRAQELSTRGVNTEATLQQAQAQLDTSRSTLERIQAVIEQKEIKAPFAGTIGLVQIDLGQFIQPGTVIATLQDLDVMKVDFTVPEQQLGEVKIGQPVLFGLTQDAMQFRGRIAGINPKIDPASRLVSVQAEVANSDGVLRPGQFINVRVLLPEQPDLIALPQTAVVTSLYGSFVYVVEPEAPKAADAPAAGGPGTAQAQPAPAADAKPPLVARQVFVQVGRRNGPQIEITSGLQAGMQVVTAGQNRLSNGSPVTVDNTVDPTKPEQPALAATPSSGS